MKHYKRDFYAQKAQNENFAARSVYKLQEINTKFGILAGALKNRGPVRILDLGAAPGSWTQYVLRTTSRRLSVVSIDLHELSARIKADGKGRLITLEGSFTDPQLQSKLCSLGPYHCILSDAAPRTTGNKTVDTSASHRLLEAVFAIATTALVDNGVMVAKIFQSEEEKNLIEKMKAHFKNVHFYRPRAVKKRSFEHYVICR